MVHDQHFLTRLERLEREHVELALGLYYDRELIEHILRVAGIPDEAERVALCLGESEAGPHLIVARDGHFVTCLGEGMQLQEGQAVISRHRLDKISETLDSLRKLVAEAAAGGQRQTQRKLERLFEAGPGLSREEFENAARWLPLMGIDFLLAHMATVGHCHELVDRLARVKKWNRRWDEQLEQYWQKSWAIAHLTLLMGSDDARFRQLFERLETVHPDSGRQMAWSLIRLGVAPFAMRGAWAASKLPSVVLPEAKRHYLDPNATFLSSLTDGLSMVAIALRHRRYQGEVRKLLAREHIDLETVTSHAEVVRKFTSVYFDALVEDSQPHLDTAVSQSKALLRKLYEETGSDPGLADQIPDEVALAACSTVPLRVGDSAESIAMLFSRLPWIVRCDASAFYLPNEFVSMVRMPWTREMGLALFESRKQLGTAREQPLRAAPKVGRNEPCPCGSGAKYKRCCGAAQ